MARQNVNKANQIQKNIRPRQVTLYRNVFYSRVSTTVVLWLCVSFLLQPIERIYADELVSTSETPPVVTLAVDASLADPDPEPSSEVVVDTPVAEVEAQSSTEVAADSSLGAEIPDSGTTKATSTDTLQTDSSSTTDNVLDSQLEPSIEPSSDAGSGSESDTSTTTTTVFTDAEIEAMLTAADKLPVADVEATSTQATTTENTVAVSNVFSDAVMQFNRTDCVTVEDGSFYCQNKKEESEQGTDGMYALQDKDGDLEIFLQKNGELKQLTFNTVDDAAPFFDAKSNSIVWHRLVDERYQIIAFDIDDNQEVQLTADAVNNMEPSRAGDYTVWQRWNGDNWDIVLYDGRETKFISDSPLHDVAPNVKGDLVMWNRLASNDTQSIELYDIVTQEFTTITDDEGGALSNPRMVLVYETEFANGDVVTKGYDVDTGEITPLANNPGELPEELPEPDATGETGAFVQPKNPTKDDIEVADDIFPPIDGLPTGSSTASSTQSVGASDLVISALSSTPATNVSSTTVLPQVTDLTLDLTPPEPMASDVPPDLVVPPFVAPAEIVNIEITQ